MALICKRCGGSNVQFLKPISSFKEPYITAVCLDCGAEF